MNDYRDTNTGFGTVYDTPEEKALNATIDKLKRELATAREQARQAAKHPALVALVKAARKIVPSEYEGYAEHEELRQALAALPEEWKP